MWITALNLGVTHNQVARTAPEVLELLRAEAQPPVTKAECQEYQRGTDNNLNRQNMDPPIFSQAPVLGSLGGTPIRPLYGNQTVSALIADANAKAIESASQDKNDAGFDDEDEEALQRKKEKKEGEEREEKREEGERGQGGREEG
jgi:hypothetical protein